VPFPAARPAGESEVNVVVTGGSSRATIDRVAEAAGVSRATVSRVMNGTTTVDPALASRVRDAAQRLDYTPSALARSLALGRTSTVGIVVPDLANPMFQGVLRGLSRAAARDGYRLLVADSAEDPSEEPILAVEARRRCDGLVLCAPRTPAEELRALLPRLSPVVLVNRDVPDAPSLVVDYRTGIHDLLEHLLDLGHTRIAYLAGPATSASNAERLRALQERVPDDVDLVELACGAAFEDGHAAVPAVLAADVTAVVAYNDLVAFGALSGLHEQGVDVPGQLSLVGFDDIPFARFTTPPLTTAATPQAELGQQAWQRLEALLRGEQPEANASFRPRLEVRGSTGPAPRPRKKTGQAPAAPRSSRSAASASRSRTRTGARPPATS